MGPAQETRRPAQETQAQATVDDARAEPGNQTIEINVERNAEAKTGERKEKQNNKVHNQAQQGEEWEESYKDRDAGSSHSDPYSGLSDLQPTQFHSPARKVSSPRSTSSSWSTQQSLPPTTPRNMPESVREERKNPEPSSHPSRPYCPAIGEERSATPIIDPSSQEESISLENPSESSLGLQDTDRDWKRNKNHGAREEAGKGQREEETVYQKDEKPKQAESDQKKAPSLAEMLAAYAS